MKIEKIQKDNFSFNNGMVWGGLWALPTFFILGGLVFIFCITLLDNGNQMLRFFLHHGN